MNELTAILEDMKVFKKYYSIVRLVGPLLKEIDSTIVMEAIM